MENQRSCNLLNIEMETINAELSTLIRASSGEVLANFRHSETSDKSGDWLKQMSCDASTRLK